MTTLAQLKRAAAKTGVTVEVEGPGSNDDVTVTLHAPAGKLFAGHELHSLGAEYYPAQDKDEGKATDYSSSLEDLDDEFIDCPDPDCAFCHPQ